MIVSGIGEIRVNGRALHSYLCARVFDIGASAESRGAFRVKQFVTRETLIRAEHLSSVPRVVGPQVICVRGPSRSGKTTVCARLIEELSRLGMRVAYVKRTHHLLDLPEKSSARIWAAGPAAMVIRATDRIQVTTAPGTGQLSELLAELPPEVDIAIVETHQPEDHPTIIAATLPPAENEQVIGSWTLDRLEDVVDQLVPVIMALRVPEIAGDAR